MNINATLLCRRIVGGGMVGLCIAGASAAEPVAPPSDVTVFAAGSTGGALSEIVHRYTGETGQRVNLVTGPAGALLDRIEHGANADLFVSANMAHPRRLTAEGKAAATVVFARNRICVQARPDVGLTSDNLLDKLLDPRVKIGTSTPGSDPGGDYAWMLFEKAGTLRPGAAQRLEAKAQQLVGGATAPQVPAGRSPVKYFLESGKVDAFVGYCSSHDVKPDPALQQVELPASLAIPVDYGMTVLESPANVATRNAAYRLALYLMSPAAQEVVERYGFVPVGKE